MSYETFIKEFKQKRLQNIYIFYGVEDYLKNYYVSSIEKLLVSEELKSFNYLFMDEDSASPGAILDFCESLPIMSDKKLLVIKKTNLLKKNKSGAGISLEGLIKYLDQMPDYVCMIFVEGDEFDKRSSLYKCIEKVGLIVNFEYQTGVQLANWIERIFKENQKTIGKDEVLYIIDNADPDMQSILNECSKIIDYCSDKESISINDMENLITRSLTSKVFDMIDEAAKKNPKKALIMLDEMIILKEPAPKILGTIAWGIKVMLQSKALLGEGLNQNEIARRIGGFYIKKYIELSKNFSIEKLERLFLECSHTDVRLKSLPLDDKILLEELIVQIAS